MYGRISGSKRRGKKQWRKRYGANAGAKETTVNKIKLHIDGSIDYYDNNQLMMRQQTIPRRVFINLHDEVKKRIINHLIKHSKSITDLEE